MCLFSASFFEPYPSKVDFDILTGVLRLGHQYQVDPLRKRALVYLSERIPLSVDVYEDKNAGSLLLEGPEIIFLLINEISADWILPCASYAACKMLTAGNFCLYNDMMEEMPLAASRKMHCGRARIPVGSPHHHGMLDTVSLHRAEDLYAPQDRNMAPHRLSALRNLDGTHQPFHKKLVRC
jgi:hypothetical protein